MPNMKDFDYRVAAVNLVNDLVNARLAAKEQPAVHFTVRVSTAALRMSFQAIDGLLEFQEPGVRALGSVGLNKIVDAGQVPYGAVGKLNEVFHGNAGILPALLAPGARDLS